MKHWTDFVTYFHARGQKPSYFRGMHNLEKATELNIIDCRLDNYLVESINKMERLQTLHLNRAIDLSKERLTKVCISSLVDFNLSNTHIDDEDCGLLSTLPNLQHLYIEDTAVTDDGLFSLIKLPKLTHLGIEGCQITDSAVRVFRAKKPKCYIRR